MKSIALASLLVGLLSACGGSDSPAAGANSSGTPSASLTSSTPAERTALCEALVTNKCTLGSSGVAGCESRLEGTSSAYVQAFQKCIGAASVCDAAYDDCKEKAMAEIAPGYPNVPVVTECKDKNLACKFDLSSNCEALVKLDAAGQARSKECAAKDCAAFKVCIAELN